MKTRLLILAILFVACQSVHAKTGEKSSDDETEWTCTISAEGINHYERWIQPRPDLRVRERKIEMVADCSYDKAIQFLMNPENSKQWMKAVKEVKELAESGNGTKRAYTIFNLPWPLNDQDMVSSQRLVAVSENQSVIKIESVNDFLPEYSKLRRIKSYYACWEIYEMRGNRAKVIFKVCSYDPLKIPKFILDPIINKVFKRDFEKLKSILSQMEFNSGKETLRADVDL